MDAVLPAQDDFATPGVPDAFGLKRESLVFALRLVSSRLDRAEV